MSKIQLCSIALLLVLTISGIAIANDPQPQQARPALDDLVEGNTFTTEDGNKYFICPVRGNPTLMEEAVASSAVDGKRYYHCCFSSQAPFRANPGKHLNNDFFLPANLMTINDNGSSFRDPVTGQTKVLKADTYYHTIGINRYFFASEKSMAKFVENPDEYVKTD